jgi:hypothetical protein
LSECGTLTLFPAHFYQFRCPVARDCSCDAVLLEAAALRAAIAARSIWLAKDPVAAALCRPAAVAILVAVAAAYLSRIASAIHTSSSSYELCNQAKGVSDPAGPHGDAPGQLLQALAAALMRGYWFASDSLVAAASAAAAAAAAAGYLRHVRCVMIAVATAMAACCAAAGCASFVMSEPAGIFTAAKAADKHAAAYSAAAVVMAAAAAGNAGFATVLASYPHLLPECAAGAGLASSAATAWSWWAEKAAADSGCGQAPDSSCLAGILLDSGGQGAGPAAGAGDQSGPQGHAGVAHPGALLTASESARGPLLLALAAVAAVARRRARLAAAAAAAADGGPHTGPGVRPRSMAAGRGRGGLSGAGPVRDTAPSDSDKEGRRDGDVDSVGPAGAGWVDVLAAAKTFGDGSGVAAAAHGTRKGGGKRMTIHQVRCL